MIVQMENPITIHPCTHRIKIRAKFVTVPIVNENGYLQINSHRGKSVAIKSITYCNNPTCSRVFDYEPLDFVRIAKQETYSNVVGHIGNNN